LDIYGYDLSTDTDRDGVPNWLDPDRPDPDPVESLVCELPYSGGWKTDISGNFIVFSYDHDGIIGIGGYDLNQKREFTVTNSTLGRIAPAICNEKVVWMDYRNGNWGIWGYSLHHDSDEDGTPDIFDPDRPELNKAGVQLSRVHLWPDPWPTSELPAVSERVAVWEFHSYVMNRVTIFGYDLQLESDEDDIPNWLDYDRPWDTNKGNTPDTLAMFCLTPNGISWRGGLAADGNFVVWEEGMDEVWDWGGAGMDSCLIYGYDLSVDTDGDGTPNYLDRDRPDPDPAEFRITTTPTKRGGGWNNGLAISGNWIVWIDFRNGNADIYGYDLSEDTDGDGTPNYCDPDRPNPDPAEKPIITDP
jgi:beta propeller repeat protein